METPILQQHAFWAIPVKWGVTNLTLHTKYYKAPPSSFRNHLNCYLAKQCKIGSALNTVCNQTYCGEQYTNLMLLL